MRRINPEWIVYDYAEEEWRTSSQAYQPHARSRKMSMTCCDQFPNFDAALEAVLAGLDGYGVVGVTFSDLEEIGDLTVHRDPLPHDAGHVLVEGTRKKSRQRALSRVARWILNPKEGEPPPNIGL